MMQSLLLHCVIRTDKLNMYKTLQSQEKKKKKTMSHKTPLVAASRQIHAPQVTELKKETSSCLCFKTNTNTRSYTLHLITNLLQQYFKKKIYKDPAKKGYALEYVNFYQSNQIPDPNTLPFPDF